MNKTALITGTSKGIGKAIAQKLLEEGYIVYGISRSKPDFEHTNFHYITMDLMNNPDFDELEKKIKTLDVLVNNAGIGYFRPLENLRENEIATLLQLNLHIPILLTKKCLNKLRASKGHIINIGSASAHHGAKFGTLYCASKFGLRGFSEALFAEVRNHEIKVTLINPGSVMTDFFDDLTFHPDSNPLCHIEAEDVAKTVSDALNMRHGSCIKEININPQKANIIHKKSL